MVLNSNKVQSSDYSSKGMAPRKYNNETMDTKPESPTSKSYLDASAEIDKKNQANCASLETNKIRKLIPYLNRTSLFANAIKDYYDGTIRGKLDQKRNVYDTLIYLFANLMMTRNLLLCLIEDPYYRAWLGETDRVRPHRQIMMVFTIWSIYVSFILKGFTAEQMKKAPLTWLEPFRVLKGENSPQTHGLDSEMLNTWYKNTLFTFRFYQTIDTLIALTVVSFIAGTIRHRWNSYKDRSSLMWYNLLQLFWGILGIGWMLLCAYQIYVCFVYFNALCDYFSIRFTKVNKDIEFIISHRLKANERVAMLHHILIEHNELCLKVSEYNKFWARYLMGTYFLLVSIICFTAFQAFFTSNLVIIRLIMFIAASLAAYIITKLSISAAIMSNLAHAPYNRLIRVTFEKYPVELQIQLRMFIQRTSGPTIGFYCLDVFEITYTTYASILAALGQNFLLIVDFVRSYAEVGREYEEIAFSQFDMLTQSVLNSTLDVLDEMAGTHISSSITNGSISNLLT